MIRVLIVLVLILSSCGKTIPSNFPVNNSVAVTADETQDNIIKKAAHVVPTQNQLAALKDEFIAFIHFGPNTFTRREWGDGKEDPTVFNLQNLDTDQWCTAIKAAGMKKVIITVKHHDGFCLWQTRYTKHGIMSSPFLNGNGDVLKSLAKSCEKFGLKLGVYLSPADLYQIESAEGLYGNLSKKTKRIIPRPVNGRPFENKTTFEFVVDDYNEYFLNQLFELLTEYGPIDEVWFDGAHPKRKGGQQYDYLAWKEVIETLSPNAVVFGKQDIRWCGNEAGNTRETEWNVVPYKEDPARMNIFQDITDIDVGSREKLFNARFLHYQPAETNTSIREGWFYRDDSLQQVRNADDVFDIYERSVGGNSIFLLNIPPNREGRFSSEDVAVLEEVGQRIQTTYKSNLLSNSDVDQAMLDDDIQTSLLLDNGQSELIFKTTAPITVNRFAIQEAVATHGERVEMHRLEAWVDEAWQMVAQASNIGYKRILRFPEVTTNQFKLTIEKSRWDPAIATVGAYYYPPSPPEISISRDSLGMVSLKSKKYLFSWKLHNEDFVKNINIGVKYRYTTDGSVPTRKSEIYKNPFYLPSGTVKARSFTADSEGSIANDQFGILPLGWEVVATTSDLEGFQANLAFDQNKSTYWRSKTGDPLDFTIDFGKLHSIKGFSYTPPTNEKKGLIEKGGIATSKDGKTWTDNIKFQFGNLNNDRSTRKHFFSTTINTRYVKIQPSKIYNNFPTAAIAEIEFFDQ